MKNIKTGDTIVVISGKNKGKKGKVIKSFPKLDKVIAEGINIVTKHTRARKQGETGGIIKTEAPIRRCKVMLVCSKCNEPCKTGTRVLNDGMRERFCKKCGVEN